MAKESVVLGSGQAAVTDANSAGLLQHAALPDLSKEEIARYSRHLIMPEVGMAGQRNLKAASVLLIGCGGLGSPLGLYLTAAGVGRISLVDFDGVDYSNLWVAAALMPTRYSNRLDLNGSRISRAG